jgi:Rho termination factor-like protein
VPARATHLHDVALDHYADRQSLVDASAEAAAGMWAEVNPNDIDGSWARLLPELTTVVSGAQLGAARRADSYTSAVLDADDIDDEAVAAVDPGGFSGVASDGRGLATLLTNPAIVTLMSIQDGFDVVHALGAGRANLDMMVRTQVADAGRLADQVALTTRPKVTGYVRLAVGNSCARCLILAGRTYAWNTGFQRHPRCDCIHVPAAIARAGRLLQSPRLAYDRMSAAERLRAGFTLGDQRAIADGADIFQVVNARRGMYTAGGRRFTTEGTTRRGLAGQRLGARGGRRVQRLSVDQIYVEAGADRDEALRLLHLHGYLLEKPAAAAARGRVRLAASRADAGGDALARAVSGVDIRRGLAKARDVRRVEREFAAEAKRITGRRIPAAFGDSAVETARAHAEGALRVLERFPDARLESLSWVRLEDATFAQTAVASGRIEFNVEYASTVGRERYLAAMRRDAGLWDDWDAGRGRIEGFHPRGVMTPAGQAAHEMGHILDESTLGARVHPAVDELLARRAAEQGVTRDVLVRRELGRYPAMDDDTFEVVAEAVADVVMNGARARALSHEVMDLVDAEYRRGGLRAGKATAVRRSADDLSRMTVPQLRALAKERGVKLTSGARKADIVAALEKPPLTGTQARMAAAKVLEANAKALVQAQELVANEASARALAHRAGSLRRTYPGGKPPAAVERVLKAMESGDRASIERAVASAERSLGLRRIESAGDVTRFDRRTHKPIGQQPPDGSAVRVVRPGYSGKLAGETVVVEQPVVQVVDEAFVAQLRHAEVDQARAVAELLGEVSDGVAAGVGKAELRLRVEAAAARLGVPEAVSSKLIAAIRSGDAAAVRRAVTATRTKAKLKVVGTAGKTTSFDRRTHTVSGPAAPKPGARVVVVRPGHTVTLRSGEVVQVDKAVVRVVEAPPTVELPNRQASTIQEIIDEFGPRLGRIGTDFEADAERRAFLADLRNAVGRAIDGRYGDLSAAVTQVSVLPSGGFLSVRGEIRDADGRVAGTFSRVFHDHRDGQMTAEHVLLQLARRVQGSGFAERFNRNLYDWYRRSGIARVEVHADIDVGGYTWATQGFDFRSHRAANSWLLEARSRIDRALRRTPKGLTREQVQELDQYIARIESGEVTASAPEIARFGRQPGQGGRGSLWAGKWIMLRSDWLGVLHL